MSPMLFNLVLVDLEEEMERVKLGRVTLGEKRIFTLSYADNMVLIAEGKDEMRSIIKRLEGYMDREKN